MADDFAPVRTVINHAVGGVEHLSGARVEVVRCLHATAALVTASDLVAARRMLYEGPTDGSCSARLGIRPDPAGHAAPAAGGVEMLFPEAVLAEALFMLTRNNNTR
jgi:hypothetical protein